MDLRSWLSIPGLILCGFSRNWWIENDRGVLWWFAGVPGDPWTDCFQAILWWWIRIWKGSDWHWQIGQGHMQEKCSSWGSIYHMRSWFFEYGSKFWYHSWKWHEDRVLPTSTRNINISQYLLKHHLVVSMSKSKSHWRPNISLCVWSGSVLRACILDSRRSVLQIQPTVENTAKPYDWRIRAQPRQNLRKICSFRLRFVKAAASVDSTFLTVFCWMGLLPVQKRRFPRVGYFPSHFRKHQKTM